MFRPRHTRISIYTPRTPELCFPDACVLANLSESLSWEKEIDDRELWGRVSLTFANPDILFSPQNDIGHLVISSQSLINLTCKVNVLYYALHNNLIRWLIVHLARALSLLSTGLKETRWMMNISPTRNTQDSKLKFFLFEKKRKKKEWKIWKGRVKMENLKRHSPFAPFNKIWSIISAYNSVYFIFGFCLHRFERLHESNESINLVCSIHSFVSSVKQTNRTK